MFKKITLESGLRIITAPMKGTNTVTILVLCGTGSDYESQSIGGISHFLEHMFFKGTTRRPEPEVISEELDGMGSNYNAFTSHEITGYFIKAGKTYFDNSLDILADIYGNSLLKEDEIEREKQVIIEEMNQDRDTPMTYIWWIWERLLYGDQAAGWDVIGTEATVRSLKRQQFVDYFYHQYVASNTVVVIAGNFDEASAVAKTKELFAGIRHELPIQKKASLKEEQIKPETLIHYKETDQTHLIVGYRGFEADNPRRYAAEVLATILGSGMSSRMFVQIREKLGLAYTVLTGHESYSNRGYLVTYAGVSHSNAEKTVRAIGKEYRKILDIRVSEKELARVKDHIRGKTLISLEASNAVANFVGSEEILTGKPMTVEEVFAKIDSVTPEDIQAAAKEIMRPERLNLAIIGPFKDAELFGNLLREF